MLKNVIKGNLQKCHSSKDKQGKRKLKDSAKLICLFQQVQELLEMNKQSGSRGLKPQSKPKKIKQNFKIKEIRKFQ